MSKYLYILNWTMALIVCLSWFYLKPVFGLAIFIGSVIGGMLTAGFVSWQYHNDKSEDKDLIWRNGYFGKDYLAEVLAQILLVAFFIGLSFLIWHSFFAFLSGMALMWCVSVMIEALWYLLVIRKSK